MQLYFEKHDSDIGRIASSDAMRTVLSLWDSSRRNQDIPNHDAFNVSASPQLAARSLFAVPSASGDFEFIYIGFEVAEDIKVPLVGVSVRSIGEHLGQFLADCFLEVTKSLKPLYTIHHSELVQSVHTWENLILPVRLLDGQIAILMHNGPLQHHQGLLASVLETVHEGIVSLRAVRDEDDAIVDAIVISANTAAERLICGSEGSAPGQRLSDLVPDLWQDHRWAKHVEVMETGQGYEYQSQIDVGDDVREIRVCLNKMGDGLTATFSDITQFVQANEKLEKQHQALIEANESLQQQALELAALATNLENTHTELNREIRHRKALEVQLRRQAETDHLTGIANRRRLLERGAAEVLRAKRYQRRLSAIMIDIDHFKAVNDTYGHAAGDTAILSIAELCRASVRDGADVVGRLGGEEFAILLPETDLEQTKMLADRIREKCENLVITHEGASFSVTISLGIATIENGDTEITQLINRADGALYAAKNAGRNRVAVATDA